jgi:hypothetical protein
LNATQYQDLADFIFENDATIAYSGLADLDPEPVHLVSSKVDDEVIIKPRATKTSSSHQAPHFPLAG